jgi:putative ATP-dependent endonuclease of OLD family
MNPLYQECSGESTSLLPLRELSPEVIDPAFERLIENLLKEAESPEDFVRATRAQAAKWDEEIGNLRNKPLAQPLHTFAGDEVSIPSYISKLAQTLAAVKMLHLQERRRPIGREEAGRLLELKMSRGGPAVLRNLQETVSALLGVQIDAFRSDVAASGNSTPAELDVDNFLVQVNGAGIREALRLILDYEFLKPEILLIEEPEVHLHPGLETRACSHYYNI